MIWKKNNQHILAVFVISNPKQQYESWGPSWNITGTVKHSDTCEGYQESTEHVEADEVDNGKTAAARSLLSGVVVGLWVTQLPRQTGQHDLLPGLTCRTPDTEQ